MKKSDFLDSDELDNLLFDEAYDIHKIPIDEPNNAEKQPEEET